MYPTLSSTSSSSSSYGDTSLHPPPPFFLPTNAYLDVSTSHGSFLPSSSFLPTSPPSITSSSSSLTPNYYLQRSNSLQSFPLHHGHISDLLAGQFRPLLFSSPSPSSCEFNTSPVRRVFSTGDLQVVAEEQGIMNNGLPALAENYRQESSGDVGNTGVIAGGVKVGRYSAEERKERIEKYRSKRNQRNFHKKITYACRKTLADSRPRVKGRFARNGEPEMETETESMDNSYDYLSYGSNDGVYTANSGNSENGMIGGGDSELWMAMQAVLEREEDEDGNGSGVRFCDDELLAGFFDVSSMNLFS